MVGKGLVWKRQSSDHASRSPSPLRGGDRGGGEQEAELSILPRDRSRISTLRGRGLDEFKLRVRDTPTPIPSPQGGGRPAGAITQFILLHDLCLIVVPLSHLPPPTSHLPPPGLPPPTSWPPSFPASSPHLPPPSPHHRTSPAEEPGPTDPSTRVERCNRPRIKSGEVRWWGENEGGRQAKSSSPKKLIPTPITFPHTPPIPPPMARHSTQCRGGWRQDWMQTRSTPASRPAARFWELGEVRGRLGLRPKCDVTGPECARGQLA